MARRIRVLSIVVLICASLLCISGTAFAADAAEYSLKAGSAQIGTNASVTAPSTPSIKSAYSKAAGKLTVKAKLKGNADGFQFAVARDDDFKVDLHRKRSTAYMYQFSNLTPDEEYYVKVRAYRIDGNKRVYGEWSSTRTVQVKAIRLGVVGSTSSGAGGWLKRSGCQVVKISNARVNPARFDGLIIPGGGDVDPALYNQKKNKHDYGINRKLDKLQIKVIRKFADAGKPIIGICRGQQIINVAFGGTLYQHIKGWHRGSRKAKIKKGSWLYSTFGSSERVYHSHHQCVFELGDGLVATQWDAKDKHIEAIEHTSLPIYGLQWHPEQMGSRGRMVAKRFMKVCLRYSKAR